MPKPGEHKTVQARILKFARQISCAYVPREEAERRRGFDPSAANPSLAAEGASLRVAVNTTVDPNRIVSVFFDRKMKGKL